MDLQLKGDLKSQLTHVKVTTNFGFWHIQYQRLRADNPVGHIVIPRRRRTVEEFKTAEIIEKYFECDELKHF